MKMHATLARDARTLASVRIGKTQWRFFAETRRLLSLIVPLCSPSASSTAYTGDTGTLLKTVAARAHANDWQSAVIILWPPPPEVLRPGAQVPRLSTLAERELAIAASGINLLILWPFTLELSRLTPRDFMRLLRDRPRPARTRYRQRFCPRPPAQRHARRAPGSRERTRFRRGSFATLRA